MQKSIFMLHLLKHIAAAILMFISFRVCAQDGKSFFIAKKDNKPYKNRALIIGTDRYADRTIGDLNNPVFDAKSVKVVLEEKYGFITTPLIDRTRIEILTALAHLREEVEKDNSSCNTNLLVFVAGHGKHSSDYGGYLIPSDAPPVASGRSDKYLYFSDLDTMIDNIPAKHILVILDVCYGGTFNEVFKRKRGSINEMYADKSEDQIIARRNAFVSRKYLASGGKEQVNDGVPDKHSPFVDRLIKLLENHYATGQALLFTELCNNMTKMVDPTPVFDNFGLEPDPAGDFILQPLPNPNAAAASGKLASNDAGGIGSIKVVVIPRASGGRDLTAMLNDPDIRLGLSKVQEMLEAKGISTVGIPEVKAGIRDDVKKQLVHASGANVYLEVDFARNVQEDTYSLTVTLNAVDVANNATLFYKSCPSGYFRTTDYGILTARAIKQVGDELAMKITGGNR
ncbi:MAG: hypothetical protein BGO69_04490 [Bacteroidetes bacterium 46-16]|nr:MAG: hypothetical protein BGO69_04490 [Bacteroidetes bacterium 46-16]